MGEGGGPRRAGRGNRRTSHEAQSSSEYSSSYSQGRGSAQSPDASPHSVPVRHYGRAAESPETQSDEEDWPVRSNMRGAPPPRARLTPGETSDDGGGSEQDDDVPLVGHSKERRNRKVLSHAERAAPWRDDSEDEDDVGDYPLQSSYAAPAYRDETEDEEEVMEVEVEPEEDGDTEDEVEDYATVLRRAHVRAESARKRSPWAQCHPIVAETAKMLEMRGSEPSELGYAKLVGNAKVSFDFLVRKQTIIIGRSTASADCVIKSDARLISRKHAKLSWDLERKEWVIYCLSEKNGILVNGIPLVPTSLAMVVKSRDLIEIGDASFFFLAAAAPDVIRVNDIINLDKQILKVRAQEERERAECEEERRRNEARYGSLRQGRFLHPSKKYKEKMNKRKALESHRQRQHQSERVSAAKRRSSSVFEDEAQNPSLSRKRMKRQNKGNSFNSRSVANGEYATDDRSMEGDPDMTEDEEDDRPKPQSRHSSDKRLGFGLSKRRTDRDMRENEGRRGRIDDDDSARFKEEWTKKERTDFARALFAVGVDPVFDDDDVLDFYDWSRFRKIAELPKKTDDMLEDYYIRVMTDVNSLLENEEREKRTKGPKTKHKPGCDCIVCKNTRRSRRKKQEERGGPFEDDRAAESEAGDEAESKSTYKAKEKLVGLVTAQKLRVRLGIHEAARKVTSFAGDTVFNRLGKQQDLHVKDFPEWWKAGYHDRTLMLGTAIHGVGQWADIWHDSKLKAFRKQKERDGPDVEVEWPTTQAAMKRVRDLASLINSELKREAKRAAKEDRGYWPNESTTKPKLAGPSNAGHGKTRQFVKRKKPAMIGGHDVQIERNYDANVENGDAESTEKTVSENENETVERFDNSQVETEDEEDVVLEVEEEVEVDEDGSGDEDGAITARNPYSYTRGGVAEKKPAVAGGISTDDDEDDEDNIQYETASETGSD